MDRSEYERRRRALEAQRQADLELIEAGHLAKVRSLEAVWAASQAAAGGPEGTREAGAGTPAVSPAMAQAAAEAPARARKRSWWVFDAIADVLPQLPDEFDTNDLVRALGQRPHRTTFYRAIEELIQEEFFTIVEEGTGKRPTRYRKHGDG